MPASGSALPPTARPLVRGVQRREEGVLQAKRRIFRVGLSLVTVSTLFLTAVLVYGQTNYPSFWAYMLTNLGILALCAASLLALGRLENVRRVEVALTVACLVYLFYWDIMALAGHYQPSAEFLMTSLATFLLGTVLACLVTARERLMGTLLSLFAVHEALTWANLLQFPWNRIHSAQLMSDILSLVAMLCLSLLGTYQHMIASSHEEAGMMQLLAHTDPLTGLLNRRAVYAQVQAEPQFALLLMDVDNFKRVNEICGHDAGDGLLVSLAQQLQDCVGLRGSVGRWGGQEFLVLLPAAAAPAALALAEQIRRRAERSTNAAQPVTLSIGLTQRRATETAEQTLLRADHLLASAKQSGKNRVESDVG